MSSPTSYDERVLPSIGNEVLKATVAQFDGTFPLYMLYHGVVLTVPASELITNREIVSARIRDDLLNRAKEFNIMLEDVSIVSLRLLRKLCARLGLSAHQDVDPHDIR